MSCVLRIYSDQCNVLRYVEVSAFDVIRSFKKGEPNFPKSQSSSISEYWGLNIDVSRHDMDEFKEQVNDAIQFLKDKKQELEKLHGLLPSDGVAEFRLDFGVGYTENFSQSHVFPSELLQLAGNAGIDLEISIYKCVDDDET